MRQILVHGYEYIEFAGVSNETKKRAVFYARPTSLGNRVYGMVAKFSRKILWQTFIQENAHQAGCGMLFNIASADCSRKATACDRDTVGNCSKNASSGSPASR